MDVKTTLCAGFQDKSEGFFLLQQQHKAHQLKQHKAHQLKQHKAHQLQQHKAHQLKQPQVLHKFH